MKNQLIVFIVAVTVLAFASCRNEDETFHPLTLKATDIDLVQDKANKYKLCGEIGSDGIEFTLQGTDQYSDMAYVTNVMVDGIECKIEPNIKYDDTTTYKGDWGEIVNSSVEQPCKMFFHIKPNPADKERVFDVSVGYGYWYRDIKIVQAKWN